MSMCRFPLGSDNSPVTQFTMTTLEELGLLKMDFLGLRTLTVIQNAARLAEAAPLAKTLIWRRSTITIRQCWTP